MKVAGENGNEWSSTLYTDGENYYFSELNTDGASNHVSYPAIPKGFKADGYVHNHPKGVSPWPSGPEGGVFSDVGFATIRQKPVWNIDHEGYVYRYIPNSKSQPLGSGVWGASRWEGEGGISGFKGKLR